MAVKSSGTLSFNTDIVGEFGGTAPHSLSEYKRNGSLVPDAAANSNIPTTNAFISFSDYYGSTSEVFLSSPSGTNLQEIDAYTYLTGTLGWDGSSPVTWTIPSDIWIWSDNTSVAALTIPSTMNGKLTIINNGKIIGKGGAGGRGSNNGTGTYQNGYSGGSAISNSATGVTLTNNSGAYIAGGGGGGGGGSRNGYGGGGGGGAGGGAGGYATFSTVYPGGAGGSIGQTGGNGSLSYSGSSYALAGVGGGAGGSGARPDGDGTDVSNASGGGGGRILPGVGGDLGLSDNASNGGSGGGSPVFREASSGGGGGGWGASGGYGDGSNYGSPGSGGAAISGTAIATYTNNGTVYGSVA